jgi:hypothetical protein
MFIEGRPISTLLRYRNYKAQPSILSRLVTMLPDAIRPALDPALLIEQFIRAMNNMAVRSIWLQLFNADGELDRDGKGATSALVAALKSVGIVPVGWGYCYSKNASTDVALASRLCGAYGINAFVADVEPGNIVHKQADTWDRTAFATLIEGLNAKLGKDNLGISTFANMRLHPDALKIMLIAEPYVCMYAPQVYWFDNLPATYVRQTLETWRAAGITTPLVATVQSYWDLQEGTPAQGTIECKVQEFISLFADDDWRKLIGLNWYHAGGQNTSRSGAMSDPMIDAIVAGHLNYKPYAPAIPSA